MTDKKTILLGLVLLALLAAGGYFFVYKKNPNIFSNLTAAQTDVIKAKAEKFINEKMLSSGSDAKITDMVEENGLYKITVLVQGQEIPAYVSKDGKNFFTQAYNMDAAAESSASKAQVTPSEVPNVELFVMSYCPYGLQMEKGILPVLSALGSKINFSLKFVDYAMHGEKEIQENLRQYCIQQQGADKLVNYLKVFTTKDDYAAALSSAGIKSSELNSCIASIDSQFKITEKFKDEAQWENPQFPPFDVNKAENEAYQITGSPSLVINGTLVSSSRDPKSILSLICSAFNNKPEECNAELSAEAPASGFSEGTGTNSDSSCAN